MRRSYTRGATDARYKRSSPAGMLTTLGSTVTAVTAAATGRSFASANDAILVKVTAERDMRITKLVWGSATVTGTPTMDIGLYEMDGTLIEAQGSASWTGTGAEKTFTLATPYELKAGESIYVAMSGNNNDSTFRGGVGAAGLIPRDALGNPLVLRVATSHPLPSPIVPGSTTSNIIPYVALRED